MIRIRLVGTIAVGMLVVAACGSDSGTSGAQADAADAAIEAAAAEGIELDEDCVNDLVGQLSDEDAAAIAAAGPEGDADVSAEGEAIGLQLLGCAGNDAIAEAFITQLKSSGQEFDEDCVRENLQGVDLAEVGASGTEEVPEELLQAVFDCIDLGG